MTEDLAGTGAYVLHSMGKACFDTPSSVNQETQPPVQIASVLTRSPVIPVVTINSAANAAAVGRALLAGGITVVEVTLRTDAAMVAIREIVNALPEMMVGAGTVVNANELAQVRAAGCHFAVSPATTPSLIDAVLDSDMAWLPGVSTPAEMMVLAEHGFTHQKLFPAQASGGIALLKSVAAPLSELKFCPTGGIDSANAGDYLKLSNVVCVGGSWIAPAADIDADNFDVIETRSRDAMALRNPGPQ